MGKSGSLILGRYAGRGYPLPKSFDLCGTQYNFLSDPGVPGVRSMGPSVTNYKTFVKT